MCLRPRDDVLGVLDHLAVVEHQGRHPRLPGQPLDLLAAARDVRQWRETVGLDDLRIVPGILESVVRVPAGMAAGSQRVLERAPADVELHLSGPLASCAASIGADSVGRAGPGCDPLTATTVVYACVSHLAVPTRRRNRVRRRIRSLPTPAMVVACIAVVLAMTGSAFAARSLI